MTRATNRRAVIGAVIAAGALGAVPITKAIGSPTHPDAALLALGPEVDAADREYELRAQATSAAGQVYFSINQIGPKPIGLTDQKAAELMAQGRWNDLGEELRKYHVALKAWQENLDQAWLESGLPAAEEAQSEADSIRLHIRDEKIVPTRARTLRGLIFKARYAATHFENAYDEDVMTSIVDDLLAIAEDADRALAEDEEARI
jgi:hypothetical protein